jgi:hypothetical protein
MGGGNLLGQSLVRTMAVVVAHIVAQDPLEVMCVHDQQVIEAFRSDCSYEALGVSVGIRGPKRCAQHPSTTPGEDGVEARDVLGVPVAEKELYLDALIVDVSRHVSRLLGDPGRVRMGCDPGDPDSSATELDEEEYVEPFEHDRVYGEEVGSDDARRLDPQERPPRGTSPSGGGPETVVLQDPSNRAPSQPDAEFDQLALDPAVAPPGVLAGQTHDERGDLLVNRWATGRSMRISPAPRDEPTVPGEERLGCHRKAPPGRAGEKPAQRGDKGAIGGLVGRAPDLASENGDLVSQGKELDVLLALGAISEGDELRESADGKVCERPELASCSVPSHPATVAEPGMASPYSGVRSSLRIVRDSYRLKYRTKEVMSATEGV